MEILMITVLVLSSWQRSKRSFLFLSEGAADELRSWLPSLSTVSMTILGGLVQKITFSSCDKDARP